MSRHFTNVLAEGEFAGLVSPDEIKADRRRVAERVREACAEVASPIGGSCDCIRRRIAEQIRALDLDKLLEEE